MAAIQGLLPSSQNQKQNSVYPLPLFYDMNGKIFSYLDRAAQLSATRVSKNWRVFMITQKQADQFRRVQKVLQFLENQLQEKYPEVVRKCRECLTANPTADSLYETDFFTNSLCRDLAKELKFVSSEELIRLQGIFGPQEDKPFAFESLLFQARAKQLLLPFAFESLVFHARAKQLPLIENVQERARVATQLDSEALPCFEKLLSKGAICRSGSFYRLHASVSGIWIVSGMA